MHCLSVGCMCAVLASHTVCCVPCPALQVGYDAGQRPAEKLTSRMRSRAGAGGGEGAGGREAGGGGGRLKEQLITRVLQGAAGAGDQNKKTDTLHALMDML
jgi:hypothetical protein